MNKLMKSNIQISLIPRMSVSTFGAVLAAVLLFASETGAHAQQVVDRISASQLKGIFQEQGYSYKLEPNGNILWRIEGVKAAVMRSKDGNHLTFRVYFGNSSTTLAKINAWNKSKKFSRSYLDDDGDPVLQLDLELDGGVTMDRVADFLKTCRASLDAWVKEVVQ